MDPNTSNEHPEVDDFPFDESELHEDTPSRSEREYGNVNDYHGVPRGEL